MIPNEELMFGLLERLPMGGPEKGGYHRWWPIQGRAFGVCWVASEKDLLDIVWRAGEARRLCFFSFAFSARQEKIGTELDVVVEEGPYRLKAIGVATVTEARTQQEVKLIIGWNGTFAHPRVFEIEDPTTTYTSAGRFAFEGSKYVETAVEALSGYVDIAGETGC